MYVEQTIVPGVPGIIRMREVRKHSFYCVYNAWVLKYNLLILVVESRNNKKQQKKFWKNCNKVASKWTMLMQRQLNTQQQPQRNERTQQQEEELVTPTTLKSITPTPSQWSATTSKWAKAAATTTTTATATMATTATAFRGRWNVASESLIGFVRLNGESSNTQAWSMIMNEKFFDESEQVKRGMMILLERWTLEVTFQTCG